MLLKNRFLLLYLFSNVELDLNNTEQSLMILNVKVEMLFEFQNVMNFEISAF